jgi:hypothetical protein
MDIAGPKRVIVSKTWASRGASIFARDNSRRFNDVLWIVCTIEEFALVELTLTHVAADRNLLRELLCTVGNRRLNINFFLRQAAVTGTMMIGTPHSVGCLVLEPSKNEVKWNEVG